MVRKVLQGQPFPAWVANWKPNALWHGVSADGVR